MISLISSPKSELAKNVIKDLKIIPIKKQVHLLSNQEIKVAIEDCSKSPVAYILQSILTNDHIMEICLIANALKYMGTQRVICIVPFFIYSRQDKISQPGEANAFTCLMDMLEAAGVDEIVTLDVHNEKAARHCKIKLTNLATTKIFANIIDDLSKSIIIAPDQGACERAKSISNLLGIKFCTMEKKRLKPGRVKIEKNSELQCVQDKHCYIIDDILDSGNTIRKVSEVLSKYGANSITALISHGLFGTGALENIKRSKIKRVYITNSIPTNKYPRTTVLDASSIITDYLNNQLAHV